MTSVLPESASRDTATRDRNHCRTTANDLLGNAPEWQERSSCSSTDPEAWFPDLGGSSRYAKRICKGCEVKDECLEYALAHDERFGIWGGLSERERRKLKRRAI